MQVSSAASGRSAGLVLALCAAFVGVAPSAARADDEPWLLHLEATAGKAVSSPQRDWYGAGGGLAAGVTKPVLPWLGFEGQLRMAGFLDGDRPKNAGVKDPGNGTLNTASLGFQLRLPDGTVRRGTGLWGGAMIGVGLTGKEVRPTWEAGIGYGFGITETIALGPVIRYVQVIQPNDGLSRADARIILGGIRLSLFDKKPAKEEAPRPVDGDRDGDGIFDSLDRCPDVPEDKDGFEDEDGCPEADNDRDGIPDETDACPNVPEDKDGFQDEDGCPDDDNDKDGIPDKDDQCPNEPETVNGERDDDGCPDEGLIVMQDDRIRLEEKLLFDTGSSVIKKSSDGILRAVVKLQSQHPEWSKVSIEGHADERGDFKYNQDLSERRAAATREALVKLGLPADMAVSVGYGKTRPLVPGNTPEAYSKNRRVEFVVIARHPKSGESTSTTINPAAPAKPEGKKP